MAGQHLCLPHIWCQRGPTTQTAVCISGPLIFRSPGTSTVSFASRLQVGVLTAEATNRPFKSACGRPSTQTLSQAVSATTGGSRGYNYQEEEQVPIGPPQNPLPVLWFFIRDHSCDLLNHPSLFHPGRRDLPLRKGTGLSWQGWKGGLLCAAHHLSVHTFCDQRQKA